MEQAKLKDVTVMWAFFQKVNDMSGKYQVDLCNLTPEHIEALDSLGVPANSSPKRPEKGFFITCKSTRPMTALGQDGAILNKIIGNGSKANVLIAAYDWTFKGKKGKSPSLAKMVVTDLKDMEGGEDGSDDDDLL